MSKTLQEQHTKLNKTKNKQKEQKCRQSVVTGRQQLYCVVQSRSPSHCQMTTEKVQSSARDGMSSVTVHSWQMTAGCSMHVLKPLVRHGRRALNVWWTVPPAWLGQQMQTASSVDVRCPDAPSKVRRRCSMKTTVGQNAQSECDGSIFCFRVK